jgi:transcriptional regulator with XRE-family HTH domain
LLQSRCVTLGKRIAARRLALGLSQNELARRAGVNHPTLYKIETGQRLNPSIGVVVQIAVALGTTAEALYGIERELETQLLVDANKISTLVTIRPLGRKLSDSARSRAHSFVASALERAGVRVREVPTASADDAEESRPPSQAGHLAAGGLALVEALEAVRRRLDSLEAWRRSQEGRARKRASR